MIKTRRALTLVGARRVAYYRMETMVSRAEYQRTYRATHSRIAEKQRARTQSILNHQFIGIDGEGWTVNGQHEYTMIATSTDRQLYLGRPLTTVECLEFIGTLPVLKHTYYVSYFFDYDVTMILRTMARDEPELAYSLFTNGMKYVWWNGYGIKYRPHKAFTVCKRGRKAVTIHDTGGFFQSSFVKALEKYDIGSADDRAAINAMKLQRSSFEAEQAKRILQYSQHECKLLVQLIEHIRDAGHKAGLSPYPYEGPGGLASNALRKHYGQKARQNALDNMPDSFDQIMLGTMYGGRFETMAVGNINQPVDEYDLSSAYPYAMSQLPCLIHGRWARTRKNYTPLSVSHIHFKHHGDQFMAANPLPVRQKDGTLFFPSTGSGWYWRNEYDIDDPEWEYTVNANYSWIPSKCDCQPFAWVRDLYHQRQEMEREHKGSGIALKLGLNTLYGKMAQRRPAPGPWLNMVYASLITSETRRRVYEAYRQCGRGNVIMFATDAIFTINGTKPETGKGLGQFEKANNGDSYPNLTIIQPGVYFSDERAHFKTRGVPKRLIMEHAKELIIAAELGHNVTIEMQTFNGLRLSLANKHYDKIGQWTTQERTIDTRLLTKRTEPIEANRIKWTSPAINAQGESQPLKITGNPADIRRMMDELLMDDETMWEE